MLDAVGEMDPHYLGAISKAFCSEDEQEEREERRGDRYIGRDGSGNDRFRIGDIRDGCILKRPHRPFDR